MSTPEDESPLYVVSESPVVVAPGRAGATKGDSPTGGAHGATYSRSDSPAMPQSVVAAPPARNTGYGAGYQRADSPAMPKLTAPVQVDMVASREGNGARQESGAAFTSAAIALRRARPIPKPSPRYREFLRLLQQQAGEKKT